MSAVNLEQLREAFDKYDALTAETAKAHARLREVIREFSHSQQYIFPLSLEHARLTLAKIDAAAIKVQQQESIASGQ